MKKITAILIIGGILWCSSGCSKKNNYPNAVASFSISTVNGNMHAPVTIDFNNVSSYAWAWHWLLGDGDTSSLQNPSHQYTKAGNYSVTLSSTGFSVDTSTTVLDILPAYTSIQIDTIQLQNLLESSTKVLGYFRITNGNGTVYWQSGNLTINAFNLPTTYTFGSTPVLSNLNATYYIELWTQNELGQLSKEKSTPVTPYEYNKGTNSLDSYPTTIEGEAGLAFGVTWK